MLNKVKGVLILSLLMFILSGCNDQEKPREVIVSSAHKKVMSTETELSASHEERTIIEIMDTTISERELERIFKNTFGINSVSVSEKNILISYNPTAITPDSVRVILRKNNISVKR